MSYRLRSFGATDQADQIGPGGYPSACDVALASDPALAATFAEWVSSYTTGTDADKARVAGACALTVEQQQASKLQTWLWITSAAAAGALTMLALKWR